MKREEQSFDELIRGKLENRSFTPNPQSWQKAEQLMKAKQLAKTGFSFSKLAVAATTLVVTGSIFALAYYFGGKKEQLASENNKVKTVQTVPGNQFTENAKNGNAAEPGKNFSSKQEEVNTGGAALPATGDKNIPAKDLNVDQQQKNQNKDITAENHPEKTNSEKTAAHTNHPGKASTENAPGKNTAAANSGNAQSKTKNSPGQNSNKPKQHGQQEKSPGDNFSKAQTSLPGLTEKTNSSGTKNAADTQAQAANTGDENAALNSVNGTAANSTHANAPVDSNSIAAQPSGANAQAQTAGTSVYAATQPADSLFAASHPQQSSAEKTLPSSGANLPQTGTVPEGNADLAASHVAQEQSAAEKQNAALPAKADSVNPNTLPPPPRHNTGTSYVFAQAGMSFIPAFSSNDHSGRSLNPVLGGGFGFRLKGMWEMQLGLRYTFIGHASDSSRTYITTTYTFGAQQHYTEIRLVRLHYLTAPFVVRWHAGPNIFLAGASASYLFSSESRRSTYDEAANNNITNKRTISIFGYSQGLNRFDAQLSAGYARNFGRSWSAELSAYYGLLDLKNNAFYGVNKFERNKGLQFIVQYSF